MTGVPRTPRFTLAGRPVGRDHPPLIIAELGVNHDGEPERALELVDAAAEAGADAIKLQFFRADLLVGRTARLARYQERGGAPNAATLLVRLELDARVFGAARRRAQDLGLATILTVFSTELVPEADALGFDAYKTASPDIVHRPLIEALTATGTPLLLSTGASTADEVRAAFGWTIGRPHLFLQCVSAYPAPDVSAALGGLLRLDDVTQGDWGYSDHTTARDTGALAVAAGACALEKHFTLDRAGSGPDHAASLDPAGFTEYARLARRAAAMRGGGDKQVLAIEHDVREVSRQSLTAARDLVPGQRLGADDVVVRRPGTGLPPCRLDAVLGHTLTEPIAAGEPLRAVHLDPTLPALATQAAGEGQS